MFIDCEMGLVANFRENIIRKTILVLVVLCLVLSAAALTTHSASSNEQQVSFYQRCVLSMSVWSASLFFRTKEQTSRPNGHAQYTSSVET